MSEVFRESSPRVTNEYRCRAVATGAVGPVLTGPIFDAYYFHPFQRDYVEMGESKVSKKNYIETGESKLNVKKWGPVETGPTVPVATALRL